MVTWGLRLAIVRDNGILADARVEQLDGDAEEGPGGGVDFGSACGRRMAARPTHKGRDLVSPGSIRPR